MSALHWQQSLKSNALTDSAPPECRSDKKRNNRERQRKEEWRRKNRCIKLTTHGSHDGGRRSENGKEKMALISMSTAYSFRRTVLPLILFASFFASCRQTGDSGRHTIHLNHKYAYFSLSLWFGEAQLFLFRAIHCLLPFENSLPSIYLFIFCPHPPPLFGVRCVCVCARALARYSHSNWIWL